MSCRSLGLGEGEVTCHPTACRHDASGCSGASPGPIDCLGSGGCAMPPPCGGMAGCDAPPACGGGMAGCDAPPACGDGILGRGEPCDGSDVGGQSCASLGYTHGTLRCDDDCRLDVSACGFCGDGQRSGPEPCDGADVAAQGCASLGLGEGPIRCTPDCQLDTSQCFRPPGELCGDGIARMPEQCDAGDLAGQTCENLGLGRGTLRCTRDCRLDASQCIRPPAEFCGDGVADSSEQCDGADLAGRTCQGLGLGQGPLGCRPDCQLDTSRCLQPMQLCGDGFASFPEQCDGGDLAGQSCPSLTGLDGTLRCGPGCRFDLSGCQDPMQQDCAQCALGQCPDQTSECIATPGCLAGVMCWVQRCDGLNDPLCVIQCFGGNFGAVQVAFRTFQCLQRSCPGACGL